MTMGVPIISALGMTFCGFSISPAKVPRDSQPAYIHIMMARPRFMLSVTLCPGGEKGLKGSPVPFMKPRMTNSTKGTGDPFSPFLPAGQSVTESMNLGLAIMMWMYAGWESLGTLAGEIENPQKVIPKALMIGTPIVIVTYFLTVAALIRAGGAGSWSGMVSDASSGGTDFLVAARIVGGAALGWLMFASAVASNVGLYAGYLATGSRPAFQMSRDRLLSLIHISEP